MVYLQLLYTCCPLVSFSLFSESLALSWNFFYKPTIFYLQNTNSPTYCSTINIVVIYAHASVARSLLRSTSGVYFKLLCYIVPSQCTRLIDVSKYSLIFFCEGEYSLPCYVFVFKYCDQRYFRRKQINFEMSDCLLRNYVERKS